GSDIIVGKPRYQVRLVLSRRETVARWLAAECIYKIDMMQRRFCLTVIQSSLLLKEALTINWLAKPVFCCVQFSVQIKPIFRREADFVISGNHKNWNNCFG